MGQWGLSLWTLLFSKPQCAMWQRKQHEKVTMSCSVEEEKTEGLTWKQFLESLSLTNKNESEAIEDALQEVVSSKVEQKELTKTS